MHEHGEFEVHFDEFSTYFCVFCVCELWIQFLAILSGGLHPHVGHDSPSIPQVFGLRNHHPQIAHQIITYYIIIIIILLQFCSRRLAVVVGAPFETAGSGGCIRGKYAPPQYRDGQLWGCSILAGLRHLWRKRGSCWESVTSEVYDMDFRSFQYFWSISIYIDSYRSLRHAFQYFCNFLYRLNQILLEVCTRTGDCTPKLWQLMIMMF